MSNRTALYRHRDCKGTLLYVGISLSVASRLAAHASSSHWFAEVTSVEVEWFATREEALTAERTAIQTEHPRCNIAHVGAPRVKPGRAKAPRLRVITPDAEPPRVMRRPNETTFASADEARRFLYRELFNLEKLMIEHGETYRAIRSQHENVIALQDLGHRFWLRLTDAEFEACRWGALYEEATVHIDFCSVCGDDSDWMEAAQELWDVFLRLTFKWASRRDELEFRWPQLAAA